MLGLWKKIRNQTKIQTTKKNKNNYSFPHLLKNQKAIANQEPSRDVDSDGAKRNISVRWEARHMSTRSSDEDDDEDDDDCHTCHVIHGFLVSHCRRSPDRGPDRSWLSRIYAWG